MSDQIICRNSQRFLPSLNIVRKMGIKHDSEPAIAAFDNESVTVLWGSNIYHVGFNEGRDWLEIISFIGKPLSSPSAPSDSP